MKRSKKLTLLLCVLAGMCAAILIVTHIEERKEQIRTGEEIILALDSGSVQSLSWSCDGNTLAFHKEDAWLYDADADFPASGEKIGELLGIFESFGVSFTIENVEDYGQYGLDDPVCTIELATAEQRYQIRLGDYSKMDSKRYVSVGDGNVYLVQNDPLELYDIALRDLIDNDKTPAFDAVSEIRFAGNENYSIFYTEHNTVTYSADDVYFTRQDGKDRPLDPFRVENYLRTITSLDPADYVSYNATAQELKTYGLDSPELTVTVDYTAEDANGNETPATFVLHLSKDPKARTAQTSAVGGRDAGSGGNAANVGSAAGTGNTTGTESAAGTGSAADEETPAAYARIGDSQILYEIPYESYQSLIAASYNDLRHTKVLWADPADIRQIDIALEGAAYTLRSEKDGDERTWFYQDAEIGFDDFTNALQLLSADSFTDETPTQKAEIGLMVFLENENEPEVHIELYRYDGTYCLAAVNGEPVSLVSRAAVVELIESVYAIVLE